MVTVHIFLGELCAMILYGQTLGLVSLLVIILRPYDDGGDGIGANDFGSDI